MDCEFAADLHGLIRALEQLQVDYRGVPAPHLPLDLPEVGIGSGEALVQLAPRVLGGAARLGSGTAFAHMDPPTPWITWAATLWNASLNQNLLHPDTAPAAREIEQRVVQWLAPFFGMNGGHMTPGSTLSNLTALWAARECVGIKQVIASQSAHVSIEKSARLLGLDYRTVPCDRAGALIAQVLPDDLQGAALVLTAGTTSTGAVDALELTGRAAWTHVDAAWAGPLRLTKHAQLLAGLEHADSVAISAHKWFFQPKESSLVLFRNAPKAHEVITFAGPYLAAGNVGLLGSHGATAVPLLATLLAWGRHGIAARIERCVELAEQLAGYIRSDSDLELLAEPRTGIVVWRPRDPAGFDSLLQKLPASAVSITKLAGERWFRNVAANPNFDISALVEVLS